MYLSKTRYSVKRIALMGAILVLLLSFAQSTSAAPLAFANPSTPVFINEIHYDNDGTDSGEAIEIAGPAGTDLAGWSLVLYNGNGNLTYNTTTLSGIIPNQDSGFGTLFFSYPTNGIQNGSPDGLALVDSTTTVIQFLSYEGVIVAANGPANGMTSTDIGVSEPYNTDVGFSLQLTGTGTLYGEFTWAAASANTFGSVNTGQSFSGGPTADPILVINEIDYDQPSIDYAEFIEIKNVGTVAANLSDFTLELVNGTGGGATVYQSYILPAETLAVGDYFVICGDDANVINCDLDVSPDSNLIQNGGPDGVGLRYKGTLIDAVSYEGDTGAPYTEGSGTGLEDLYNGAYVSISRFPDGLDTDQNNMDLSLRCSSPGQANVAESSGCVAPYTDLVINEIDYDQPSTDTAEFVEIFNYGDTPSDLSGWSLEFINGNGTSVYKTINLPAVSLASGDYFVVCANAATVANCDLDSSPDTNLIQNGSPDAIALWFNGILVDTVSYEGDTGAPYTEGSGAGLEDAGADGSISRCPDGEDTNQNNVDLIFTGTITPGAANDCGGGPVTPVTMIHEVQGNGAASPLVGQTVIIEGIVVGDFQDEIAGTHGDLNGFHVQEEDADADTDPLTSEGIFIYDGSSPAVDVAVGDLVRVEGTVKEHYDLTEITSFSGVTILSSGNPLPTPAPALLPVASIDDLEAFEGMSVEFAQPLYISEFYNFARYGEIVLTTDRQYQATSVFEPGSIEATNLLADNLLSRIILDDGRTSQNSDPALHPNGSIFDLTNLFRGGDTLTNVVGVVDYAYGNYKIQPTQGATYDPINPRTDFPDYVGDGLKVASFNVLNYFTTLDSRGADTVEEFERQRAKIIDALFVIDADVVGLMEIENNLEAIHDLVNGLNDAYGYLAYDYVDTGTIGDDAIKVAFIYKTETVSLVGDYAILDSTVDPNFIDTKNRPVLAQSFMDTYTGGIFTAAVNHLKSKGSSCADLGDPDLGDGAGNCNLTRTSAAQALVDWLATDPTGSGDADFLIIGDLNSYDKEDPIDVILAGGYADLLYEFIGEDAYTYVFDGQLGYLDHALANAELLTEVSGLTVWHINADEPSLIDYDMSYKQDAQDALFEPNAYRSSDHDPVIVGLEVCDEIAPTATITLSHDELWPANHKYVEVSAEVIAEDNFDFDPVVTLVSVVSSEADEGLGDGDFPEDIVIIDDYTFELRAERDATAQLGRTYTITYQIEDACGNITIETATVFVPFSQNPKK